MSRLIYWIVLVVILFSSCRKEDNNFSNNSYIDYNEWVKPSHFPEPVYTFDNNKYSREGFELGKKIFFDKRLSVNSSVSCASCHKQEYAFADNGLKVSPGVYGLLATRNAPPLFNLVWSKSFMWDGGVNHLEVSPLGAIQSPVEMGETLESILSKLNSDDEYRHMTKAAFDQNELDAQTLFYALAQYMSQLISSDSKYDNFINSNEMFSESEKKGLLLFREHCNACHAEPLFTNGSFQNNGLDTLYFSDSGRSRITSDIADAGKFKVPSLRNVILTPPYMHDGRFATMDRVLEHYATGIQHSSTLSSLLPVGGIRLTDQEQKDIISFLKTLTDENLIKNEMLR